MSDKMTVIKLVVGYDGRYRELDKRTVTRASGYVWIDLNSHLTIFSSRLD